MLEGSYWKRRIEVVIKEYHKWRIYYKKRVRAWWSYLKKILHGFNTAMLHITCVRNMCMSQGTQKDFYSLFLNLETQRSCACSSDGKTQSCSSKTVHCFQVFRSLLYNPDYGNLLFIVILKWFFFKGSSVCVFTILAQQIKQVDYNMPNIWEWHDN